MKINLKYQPITDNAPLFAWDIVAAAHGLSGVDLDYSVASLELVDGIIEDMRRDNVPAEQIGGTLFGFGGYVGEVFVWNADAHWIDLDEVRREYFGHAIGIEMRDGKLWNPIGKVFKRPSEGISDSIPFSYSQAAPATRMTGH